MQSLSDWWQLKRKERNLAWAEKQYSVSKSISPYLYGLEVTGKWCCQVARCVTKKNKSKTCVIKDISKPNDESSRSMFSPWSMNCNCDRSSLQQSKLIFYPHMLFYIQYLYPLCLVVKHRTEKWRKQSMRSLESSRMPRRPNVSAASEKSPTSQRMQESQSPKSKPRWSHSFMCEADFTRITSTLWIWGNLKDTSCNHLNCSLPLSLDGCCKLTGCRSFADRAMPWKWAGHDRLADIWLDPTGRWWRCCPSLPLRSEVAQRLL